MTRLYLVRHAAHGLLDKALAGRMAGVVLSAEGRTQAGRLGAFFAQRSLAAVLSSPRERCRETAAAIAEPLGLAVEIDEALDEIDCGEWTGRSFGELAQDPRWRAWNEERSRSGAPGGETIGQVETRISALVRAYEAFAGGSVAFVTHADVIKAALLSLVGASCDHHHRLEIGPASVSTLDLWPGGGRIVRTNEQAAT